MAEATVFGVCSVVLSVIATPAVRSAYAKIKRIQNALPDLEKLKERVEMIQAVILDAEKRQNEHAVKIWILRVQDVLYDAEDLFDEVAANYMLKQEDKAWRVRTHWGANPSKRSRNDSKNIIADRVEDIGKRLGKISEDMEQFKFMNCSQERDMYGRRRKDDPGFVFVGSDNVIGRAKEKEDILQMVSRDDARQKVSVLAIVGIGGMGKTTLAHLTYEDAKVENMFKDRWFVSISNTSNNEEIVRKIYLSVCHGSERDLPSKDVQHREIRAKLAVKFLLVLDDVWDDDRDNWVRRKGLWSNGKKGSKVIVTTRSNLVARAMGVSEHYELGGLSEEASWDLFERIVEFTPEQMSDPEWADLGRVMIKKCANSPLAIRSIASLLHEKNSIEEWRSVRNEKLLEIGQDREDCIKQVLLLSYHHLSPELKRCFAYLSLFPEDSIFERDDVINLWISQGYDKINCENEAEGQGLSCFLGLVRRSFLQVDQYSQYRMHDLVHDLAQEVAKEECIILPAASGSGGITSHRHLRVHYPYGTSLLPTHPQSNYDRLRSFLCRWSLGSSIETLGTLCLTFKCLRALALVSLGIKIVPGSIGELKHLRYLNISSNKFVRLPDSITNLVNLYFLDISKCFNLKVLPSEFRRLANLRALHVGSCIKLRCMPPGFEELSNLQHLDEFNVHGGTETSKVDVLSGLKLRGELVIFFWLDDETDHWDGVECWHPPPTLERLSIYHYVGPRIPRWGDEPKLMLTSLSLTNCNKVTCLPTLSHLPKLITLYLQILYSLEYVQEEEDIQSTNAILPDLKELTLEYLPELLCWSRKHENRHGTWISNCPKLNKLSLDSVNANAWLHQHHNSLPSDTSPISSLRSVSIKDCDDLEIFPGESFTSLRHLHIKGCKKLNKVELPPLQLNKLEKLSLVKCPELNLWDENMRGVDWDCLSQLIHLNVFEDNPSSSPKLPDCLQRRQQGGLFNFTTDECSFWNPWD